MDYNTKSRKIHNGKKLDTKLRRSLLFLYCYSICLCTGCAYKFTEMRTTPSPDPIQKFRIEMDNVYRNIQVERCYREKIMDIVETWKENITQAIKDHLESFTTLRKMLHNNLEIEEKLSKIEQAIKNLYQRQNETIVRDQIPILNEFSNTITHIRQIYHLFLHENFMHQAIDIIQEDIKQRLFQTGYDEEQTEEDKNSFIVFCIQEWIATKQKVLQAQEMNKRLSSIYQQCINMEQTFACAICLESLFFPLKGRYIMLPKKIDQNGKRTCSHWWHAPCLNEHMSISEAKTKEQCPACKTKLNNSTITVIKQAAISTQPITILGIDHINSTTFDAALLTSDHKITTEQFANNVAGFALLERWLTSHNGYDDIDVCINQQNRRSEVACYLSTKYSIISSD